MIDSVCDRARKAHLLDWGFFLEGLKFSYISRRQIADYALEQLEGIDDAVDIFFSVVELASADQLSSEECVRELVKICSAMGIDLSRSRRVVRYFSLEELLDSLQGSEVYDLLALSEFWGQWGREADCPYFPQGVDNNISPVDYYSGGNLEKVMERHRDWMAKEFLDLKKHGGCRS